MRTRTFSSVLILLGLGVAHAGAVDLAKIDRSIRKEPVYQSNDPKYCLLAFGPEATVRVWLVLDGDVLYVDRNGNGDLTEPDERIEPRYAMHNAPERPDMKLLVEFFLYRPFKDGRLEGEPILSCLPEVTAIIVDHHIPADDRKDALATSFRKHPIRVDVATTRIEQDSSLVFTSRPGDAPILYFDGPRHLALHPYWEPLRRGETVDLALQLLTPGLDATLRMEWTEEMEKIHPVAEIECPPSRPDAEPIRFKIELPGRG